MRVPVAASLLARTGPRPPSRARMMRLLVLGAALVFIAAFAFLTYASIVEEGFSVLTVLAIFILVLLSVGIVGALRNPPRQ